MHPPTIESPVSEPLRQPISHRASPKSSRLFSSLDSNPGDKLAVITLVALIVYASARSLCQAATRPLWFDELCTWIMVQQHPLSVLWNALKDGVDGQPPLFYLLERPVAAAIANEQISYRLLSILGLACTVACLFHLIRKRSGNLNALFCAAIPLLTLLYDPYAVEARPYTLIVACLAIALVCYDRAPNPRWMLLMGLSLALAEALHYYAVLAMAPFILAEMALTVRIRRPRWAVWAALSSSLIPLAAFWPLLSSLKAHYGAHLWALPSLEGAEWSYGWFFRTTTNRGMGLAAAGALAVLVSMLAAERAASREEPHEDIAFSPTCACPGFSGFAVPEFFCGKAGAWRNDRKIHAADHPGISACRGLQSSPMGAKERSRPRGSGTVHHRPAGVAREAILVLLPRRFCFAGEGRRGYGGFRQLSRTPGGGLRAARFSAACPLCIAGLGGPIFPGGRRSASGGLFGKRFSR